MKKGLFILFMIILLLPITFSINQFTNGKSTENIVFTNPVITRYALIPQQGIILNASIMLKNVKTFMSIDRFDRPDSSTLERDWIETGVQNYTRIAGKAAIIEQDTGAGVKMYHYIEKPNYSPSSQNITSVEYKFSCSGSSSERIIMWLQRFNNDLIGLGACSGNIFYYRSPTAWTNIWTMQPNKNYTIRLDINSTSYTFDLYVNGMLNQSDLSWYKTNYNKMDEIEFTTSPAATRVNYTMQYVQVNMTLSNTSIAIDINNDNATDATPQIKGNATLYHINISKLQASINTCDCSGCSVDGLYCSQPFSIYGGNGSATYFNFSVDIPYIEYMLIDEATGGIFNVSNLTRVEIVDDYNNSLLDLKDKNNSRFNISTKYGIFRLLLGYKDGTLINRYYNMNLTNSNRLCANKDGIIHYEQYIISASVRPVIVTSLFANCLVAADYTRFAYQQYNLLRAFTIDALYQIRTTDFQGREISLASIDGGIETIIELDPLIFNKQGYNFNILGDTVVFNRIGSNKTIGIVYRNLEEDNEYLQLNITRTDTSSLLYSNDVWADENDIVLYFDYTTYSNVTNTTIFRLDIAKVDSQGSSGLRRYFNIFAKSGLISNGFAIAVAVLLTVFGLTFAATKVTFSWIGIVVQLGALAFLSFATGSIVVLSIMAINIIIMVYIAVVMVNKNFGEVS